jgi:hypothetical protein
VPIAVLAFLVLVPVNWTSGTLEDEKSISYDEIDKLSISNIGTGSKRYRCVYSIHVLYYLARATSMNHTLFL